MLLLMAPQARPSEQAASLIPGAPMGLHLASLTSIPRPHAHRVQSRIPPLIMSVVPRSSSMVGPRNQTLVLESSGPLTIKL